MTTLRAATAAQPRHPVVQRLVAGFVSVRREALAFLHAYGGTAMQKRQRVVM